MSHEGATNTGYSWRGDYEIIYPPPPPTPTPMCSVNNTYQTLPNGYPMRRTILGPASLKRLYGKQGQYYPPQYMQVPDNTLYGMNTTTYHGVDDAKVRTYGMMLYPFRQRSPHEIIGTAEAILPLPAVQEWTKYRVMTEGSWNR